MEILSYEGIGKFYGGLGRSYRSFIDGRRWVDLSRRRWTSFPPY